MKKKVLLIRLDKIGDLICTLPADQILDESLYDVTWVVQKGLGQVVELGKKNRKFFELDKTTPKKSALQLTEFLKILNPDVAISFQCPWWLNYTLYKADIPIRAGVKSQWHSFIFLNHGVRQKRSRSEKHEFEYNLELIRHTLNPHEIHNSEYFEINKPPTTEILEKYNLLPKKYIVIHPGMMGSARNWPQSEYIKYIYEQIKNGKHIVITGTDSDEPYLTEIKKEFFANNILNPSLTWLQSKLNLKELVQILAYSEYVLAPSTGVAHLAASVGANITGIYSPDQVHHPKRWGPRGPHVKILMIGEKI